MFNHKAQRRVTNGETTEDAEEHREDALIDTEEVDMCSMNIAA